MTADTKLVRIEIAQPGSLPTGDVVGLHITHANSLECYTGNFKVVDVDGESVSLLLWGRNEVVLKQALKAGGKVCIFSRSTDNALE